MTDTTNAGAVEFNGNTPQLRGLAIVTTLLTLATLGIYRFWARTRLRRYFWSAFTLDGHGFEYTGKGIEKLIGFLIAVAVLAIYLGIFQIALSFAGMSLFETVDPDGDELRGMMLTYVTFIALAPLIFYAQYRARRYMLSRTKWKGIRFGAEQAAWGYSLRAIGHYMLTIVTLGILLPRQTFYLEKYKADRTWFGSVQFTQEGRWQSLYPAMKHIGIGLLVAIIGGIIAAMISQSNGSEDGAERSYVALAVLAGLMIFIGAVWLYIGFAYYNVHSHRILTGTKTLGNNIRFTSTPRTARIIGIYLLGGLIISLLAPIIAGLIGGILGVISDRALSGVDLGTGDAPAGVAVGMVLGYITLFGVFGVLNLIFIKQPILEHYAEVTTVHNAEELEDVEQREGDQMIEAEGFADALDIGAGI
ncbi:MAG: DUF898 family protein [Proteobacteria bacterium]|nr:DUF898 family protein [Pseudomonadota bacterium]